MECKDKDTSAFLIYDLNKFKREVKSVPDLDLSLLGDIRGKSILHLQCHFGMDTLSLSKLGANVVGVDFSEEAIQTAKALNEELGLNAQFCCCNIYDAPAVVTMFAMAYALPFTNTEVIDR